MRRLMILFAVVALIGLDAAPRVLRSIRLDEKKYDEALKLLETKHSAAMETLYADLRGDVMVAQGKTAEARAALDEMIRRVPTL